MVYKKLNSTGNVDSENNHGGSSGTYVLHRPGCSQEDDRLVRQDRQLPALRLPAGVPHQHVWLSCL